MVEKVSVPCPNCHVRVRMPTYVRPGKKPKCPKCKTIIQPADVLPPELLARPMAPADPFADTIERLPDRPAAREPDPYAETKTLMPDIDPDDAPPPWVPLEETALPPAAIRALDSNRPNPSAD